jgi:hypothetical protein
MKINKVAPRIDKKYKGGNRRHDYAPLVKALQENPGAWLRLIPSELTGETVLQKQGALVQAAKKRHLRVQTSAQDGYIYVRTIEGPTAQPPQPDPWVTCDHSSKRSLIGALRVVRCQSRTGIRKIST